MSQALADQYYIKAKDAYPIDLESAIENLQFALSYSEDHKEANYLMGLMYVEQFSDLTKAESYFNQSLSVDPFFLPACYKLIEVYIEQKESKKAKKLLKHITSIKSYDVRLYHIYKGKIRESKFNLSGAKKQYEKAKLYTKDIDQLEELDEDLKRLKAKKKILLK